MGNIKCSNCLYRAYDIQSGESYCCKAMFENVNIREEIKAMNCQHFKMSFLEVEEFTQKIVEEQLPF